MLERCSRHHVETRDMVRRPKWTQKWILSAALDNRPIGTQKLTNTTRPATNIHPSVFQAHPIWR